MSTTADEVLKQLDASHAAYTFPDPGHGYYYAVDSRLHLYRDPMRWALVVEMVGYTPRGANLYDVLHVYGNCLTAGGPGFENDDFFARIENFDEVEDRDDPEMYTGAPLIIRSQAIDVGGDAGEPLTTTLRRLVPRHRELLLADERELRRRIPDDIPEILRLDEWYQDDVLERRPSEMEVYRQLATVIATGDVSRYAPTTPPNTHWSNWPQSGSL